MSKALGEVDDSQIKSSSGVYWSSEETDNIIEASSHDQLDQFTLDPVLARDQLFSIVDFSPSWTYAGSKTRVCLLKLFICSWCCEVLVDCPPLPNSLSFWAHLVHET
jgi:hypothetical protein